MSVYYKDEPAYLDVCFRSLSAQSLKPFEVILIEDGPVSVELKAVIQKHRDDLNILSIQLPGNVGLARALNIGLEKCSCDLVARMDADDIAIYTRFQKQVDFMVMNSDVSILGTYCSIIDDLGNQVSNCELPIKHDSIVKELWSCPIIHPSVMFRKVEIQRLGGYSEDLRRRQDYELWFRCAQAGLRFANIAECLLQYRVLEPSYKKNGIKFAWRQAIIGYNGSKMLGLGFVAKIGVFYPLLKSILPSVIVVIINKLFSSLDPRKSSQIE